MMIFILLFLVILALIFISTICMYYGLSMCTAHPILGFLIMTLPCALILALLGTTIVTGG